MKYKLENRELNSINDLREFKNYIDSQYNKEKNELLEEDKVVKESLYGEYLDVFVRALNNIMKKSILYGNNSESDLMINLSRILGVKLNKMTNDNNEVFYVADDLVKAINSNKVYDKTFNSIMNNKLDDILNSFENVNDINSIIKDSNEITYDFEAKDGFTEELKDKELKASNKKINKRKALYEGKSNKLKNKFEENWNNDSKKELDESRLNEIENNRLKGLANANHFAKAAGRKINISDPNKRVEKVLEDDIDFNIIESRDDLNRVINNSNLSQGSFKIVRDSLSNRKEFLNDLSNSLDDGIISNNDLLKLATLNLYSQMYRIRENRGFFEKLFHPFNNSKEKKLLSSLKQDLISFGTSNEDILSSQDINFNINNYIDNLSLNNNSIIRNNIEVTEVKNNSILDDSTISKNLNLNKSLDNNLNK